MNKKVSDIEKISSFFVSTQLLAPYKDKIRLLSTSDTLRLNKLSSGEHVSIGGIITDVRILRDRKNRRMALIKLNDFFDSIEIAMFADIYERYANLINVKQAIFVNGWFSVRGDSQKRLIASDIYDLKEIKIEIEKNKPLDKISTDIIKVSDSLLKTIINNPSILYKVSPYLFEEIIADILSKLGYNVQKTPKSHDGGIDLRIAQKSDLGIFLYLVECKRFSPDHKVGVDVIRQLYGVVTQTNSTGGIAVTTSSFTKNAINFQKSVPFKLSLMDYFNIQEWLEKLRKM